jgi:hypothetical protein
MKAISASIIVLAAAVLMGLAMQANHDAQVVLMLVAGVLGIVGFGTWIGQLGKDQQQK